jgi:hypothetical protein
MSIVFFFFAFSFFLSFPFPFLFSFSDVVTGCHTSIFSSQFNHVVVTYQQSTSSVQVYLVGKKERKIIETNI